MYGTSKEPGLAPRTMSQVWERIGQDRGKITYVVKVYMMELWKDDLIDLLHSRSKNKQHQPLIIKKDAKGMVYVQNVTEVEVSSKAEMMEAMAEGLQQRHVAETKMNRESSRSHLIFSVVLTGVDESTGRVSTGKMTLCDLAGSERVKKSEAEGEQLKEAIAINKSLSALGDVIEALTTNAKSVPYRNHKLTQLMSDSLGGNAKTLMFVNLSPTAWNAQETLSSLVYATRAKQVTNKASKADESEEIARLKQVISQLSKQLHQQQELDTTGAVRARGVGHE
jgi:phage tail sheath gpL-like